MRTGTLTLVLAFVVPAAFGAGAVLILSGGAPPGDVPAAPPAPEPSAWRDRDSQARLTAALAERDEARADAEALRRELERERKTRRDAARPRPVTGFWYHSSHDGSPTLLELREGGEVVAGEYRARWWMEGRTLRMSWPAENAPGGSWEDTCVVAEDGISYAGRNNVGGVIRGTRKPE